MIIGVPKEIKDSEFRVAISPNGVKELVGSGLQVLVETLAGEGINFDDASYKEMGAEIAKDKQELYTKSDLIVKVKEPQKVECDLMREGQILFSYLHLAAELEMTKHLLEKKIIGIAFETVSGKGNFLPLLFPMSEIAGKISVQQAAHFLEKKNGGKGCLFGGALGSAVADVVILGGGSAGKAAAEMALGMGGKGYYFREVI